MRDGLGMAKSTEEAERSAEVEISGRESGKMMSNMGCLLGPMQMAQRMRVRLSMAPGKESGHSPTLMVRRKLARWPMAIRK